ncbi:host-nuclease inhibitor Gam family protein [Campylobacter jejuni]|uniref:host-nuclease inhibitor Gam family protein n=1 Tax=Campylobacter TaxID=194 RepID=UPI0007170B8B|nr:MULTISPECIES: host-nuclease inhibitor Gam family protein [Campylobacter]EAI4009385.1 host-nuclease inhibitor protein Gam [Campylobacter jejuni]AZN10785.1 host-nuclease inhibitor protein Gam [Campylobacter jejuni subsp. jejuni]EAK8747896.1 host-nuclease inhibitor protein Gam [Campylobacter jejuni]ECQ5288532.1 host-nuclease inhibitor protein Gam [Campylobacter jejuni]ECQ5378940.1 host-nuclease inhibitor protein Gam [Campylobacter jejuni]
MQINSFEDVNLALKKVAELSVKIEKINGEVTLACNEIKEARAGEIKVLSDELGYIEQCITTFCENNKHEFAEKRSKEFTFGKIGYRLSKSVSLPRVKEKLENLIKALKSYGLNDCITYKEELNKDAIAELEDSTLVKLGLKRVVKDNFRIEPKIESLEIEK